MTAAVAMDHAETDGTEKLSAGQFEEFYAQTMPALRCYIRRVAGGVADGISDGISDKQAVADDILQESYIRLLSAAPIPEEKRKAYLYRVATNLITDYRRSLARQRRWWQRAARPEASADARLDVTSDMHQLFERISPRERALLWLAYVEGADHREIAEILRLKEKSVKVVLHRARRRMESILREHGYEAGHE